MRSDADYIEHVHKLLKKEKEEKHARFTSDINKRTAHLLDVSERTVANVVKKGAQSFPPDQSPEVRLRAPSVGSDHILAIKESYNAFVTEKKKRPTYRELFARLTAAGEWPFCMTTLFNTLQRIGYRKEQTRSYNDVTHANPAIVLQHTHMPTATASKGEIVEWLKKKGILIPDPLFEGPGRHPVIAYRTAAKKGLKLSCGCSKQYLLEIVNNNRIPPRYKVQDIVKKYPNTDVSLIILPVHHPELNPIELMWAQIKNHVRSNNVELRQAAAEDLVRAKVALLKQTAWQACEGHVKKVEDMYNNETELEDAGEIGVSSIDLEEE